MKAQTGPEFNPEIDKVIRFPRGDGDGDGVGGDAPPPDQKTDKEKTDKEKSCDGFWNYALEIMDPSPDVSLVSKLVEAMGDDYDKAYLKLLAAERANNVDAYLSKIIENERKEQRKAREAKEHADAKERNEEQRERHKAYQERKQRRASELTPLQVQQQALALMLKFRVPPSHVRENGVNTADLFPNCKKIIECMLDIDPKIYSMESVREKIDASKQVPEIDKKMLWYADNCAPPDIENQNDAIIRIKDILTRLRAGSIDSQAAPSAPKQPKPMHPPPESTPNRDPEYSWFTDHDDPKPRRGFVRNKALWIDRVLGNPDLTPSAKTVGTKLANSFAPFERLGKAAVDHITLADSVNLSRRGTQKALEALREAGLIDWTGGGGRKGYTGPGIPCTYTFMMPRSE